MVSRWDILLSIVSSLVLEQFSDVPNPIERPPEPIGGVRQESSTLSPHADPVRRDGRAQISDGLGDVRCPLQPILCRFE